MDKSSKIDRETMEHICLLAKLNLTEAEKESYARELSEVLEAFKVLDSIDAKDEPAFHPIEIRDRLQGGRGQADQVGSPRQRQGGRQGVLHRDPR